ncbi:MAG: hypothetical protein R2780_05625 [Crocinitomicaceae bacterium]
MKESQEFENVIVEKISKDVLITKYKPATEISEKDAEEIDTAHLNMAQGNDMFVIVDLTAGQINVNKSAEEFFVYKGKMMPFTRAIAIVTPQKSSVIAKIFGKSQKTLYPTKEFTDMEKALNWFDSIR